MLDQPERVRWSTTRRLEFVEFRLVWAGRVNRSDLMDTFDISPQQASADLSRYMEVAPDNMRYDSRGKTFRPKDGFRSHYLREYSDRYLLQLAAIENGWIEREDTWFGELPAVAVVPMPRRRVKATLMQTLLKAVRTQSELRVCYQSMSSGGPVRRVIAPHGFGFDGFRWHVRAWCQDHNDFRDFVVTRLSELGELRPSSAKPELDYAWHEQIDVVLAPNPSLSPAQREILEVEHEMLDGRLVIPTRVCLTFYLIQMLSLDLAEDCMPVGRRQLVMLNREEVTAAQRRAEENSAAALAQGTPEPT